MGKDGNTLLPVDSADGLGYSFNKILLTMSKDHPEFPKIQTLEDIPFELSYNGKGWVTPNDKYPSSSWTIDKLQSMNEPIVLFSSALNEISNELIKYLEKQDYLGVYVTFDRKANDPCILEMLLKRVF